MKSSPSNLIQIGSHQLKIRTDRGVANRMRQSFESKHFLKLPNLIEPSFCQFLASFLTLNDFYLRQDKGIAQELCMRQNQIFNQVQFLLDNPQFLGWIQKITGLRPIQSFDGRMYCLSAGKSHYDSWHDDVKKHQGRLLAMSINFSRDGYEGGRLEIRRKGQNRLLGSVDNRGFGDAVIFRVSPDLEHRVLPVKRGHRMAFAGWFLEKSTPMPLIDPQKKIRTAGDPKNPKPGKGWSVLNSASYAISPDTVSFHERRCAWLLNARTKNCLKLNESGQVIWKGLTQKKSISFIAKQVRQKYQISLARSLKDTRRTFRELTQNQMIQVRS